VTAKYQGGNREISPREISILNAVDTNFLLRLSLRDDANQLAVVNEYLEEKGSIWISHIVLVEAVWVMKSVYKRAKGNLVLWMENLLDSAFIALEKPEVVEAALIRYQQSNVDFSDCLILETARQNKLLPLATFDKNFAKLAGTYDLNTR
jgi:predicted nucleic-acid-binding protein